MSEIKPVAENVKECEYCGGSIDRYEHLFQCRECGSVGGLMTDIMNAPRSVDLRLMDEMKRLYKEVPKFDTECDIWLIIEGLGGVTWRMNHDVADGRITLSDKDNDFISSAQLVMNMLVNEKLRNEYNIVPPRECPSIDSNHKRPPAPKGKTYYWDWYESMKKSYFKSEYENIICFACALHEKDGVEKMQIRIPCAVFPGVVYRLTFPYECVMLDKRYSGHSGHWTEEKLLSEIKKKGGEDSVKRFKEKLILLKGNK